MGDTSDRLLEGSLNNIKKMSDYIQTGYQEVMDVGIELLENNGIETSLHFISMSSSHCVSI